MKNIRKYFCLLLLLGFAQVTRTAEDYSEISTDELKKTLMEVITEHNEDMVSKILACPEAKNLSPHDLRKALELAAKNNYVNIAHILIQAGADIKDQYCSALKEAAKNGYIDMVKVLLPVQGCDKSKRQISFRQVDIFNAHRDDALIEAAKNGHVDVMKELINAGADVNWQGGYFCDVALVEATRNGHVGAVKELLKAKASVNACNGNGETALRFAMILRDVDLIRELLMAPGIDVSWYISGIQSNYKDYLKQPDSLLYSYSDERIEKHKIDLKIWELFKPFMKL